MACGLASEMIEDLVTVKSDSRYQDDRSPAYEIGVKYKN